MMKHTREGRRVFTKNKNNKNTYIQANSAQLNTAEESTPLRCTRALVRLIKGEKQKRETLFAKRSVYFF